MTRQEAEREASRRFGDYERHRQLTRQIDEDSMNMRRRLDRLRDVQRELLVALRSLRRSPGFSVIAFLTLALGVGATTGIFSVLDTVVLRPLPYREAGALVSVLHPATVPGSGERIWGISPGGYFQFAEKSKTLQSFGIYRNFGVTVTNDNEAELVQTAFTTASLFTVLEAKAQAGRLLRAEDDRPGAPPVVVLSHEFLMRRFGGSAMVGKMLETSEGRFEIVGVAEPGLRLPMPGPFASSTDLNGFGVDIWMPMRLNPAGPFYNNHPNVGIGRLRPGVSVAAAQADLASIFSHFTEALPNVYGVRFMKTYNFRVQVESLQQTVLGPQLPRTLWMLFGAVLLVLAIATANVANLYLIRLDVRRRESALRTALGADAWQMATHHLAETLLLCSGAAVAGLLLAKVGLRAMLAIAPTNIPRLAHVALDARAAGLALGVSLMLGVVLGVLPLLRRGLDGDALRPGSRGHSATPRQRACRNTLVVGQLAMALTLLAAAGLIVRTMSELRRVDPGFRTADVLAFNVSLPYNEYGKRSLALTFHRALHERIRAMPGVVAVGSVGTLPLEGLGTGCALVFRERRPYGADEKTPCVETLATTPGVFEALRMTVDGRTPTWDDVTSRSQAVVVTRALADRLWPGEEAIGKGIGSNGPDSDVWYRVVGVARDIRGEALDAPVTEAVFYPATGLRADDDNGELNEQSYVVRTSGIEPASLFPAIRSAVAALNPHVPIVAPRAMDAVLQRSMARTTFLMVLLGLAAAVALLLSAIGIYGVISYMVTERKLEIGIRMALGATAGRVVRLVMAQSVALSAAGTVLGLAGGKVATRLMRTVLPGIPPSDPLVLGWAVLLLIAVAVAASVVPARRAVRVDPRSAMQAG